MEKVGWGRKVEQRGEKKEGGELIDGNSERKELV